MAEKTKGFFSNNQVVEALEKAKLRLDDVVREQHNMVAVHEEHFKVLRFIQSVLIKIERQQDKVVEALIALLLANTGSPEDKAKIEAAIQKLNAASAELNASVEANKQ